MVQRQRMIKKTLLWTFQREPLILCDTLTVVGKDGDGNESQPTEVTVPEDATVAAPTVTTVTGTTATGYQVTGTAEPKCHH